MCSTGTAEHWWDWRTAFGSTASSGADSSRTGDCALTALRALAPLVHRRRSIHECDAAATRCFATPRARRRAHACVRQRWPRQARPWTARLREALSSEIRAPWRRAHVALDLTDDVKTVLAAATVRAAPSLAHGRLRWRVAPRRAVVHDRAFPGATEQAAHADVPRDTETPTATLWVLLQDVGLESVRRTCSQTTATRGRGPSRRTRRGRRTTRPTASRRRTSRRLKRPRCGGPGRRRRRRRGDGLPPRPLRRRESPQPRRACGSPRRFGGARQLAMTTNPRLAATNAEGRSLTSHRR